MKALYRIRIVAFAIDGIPSLILYYRISSSLFPNFAPVGADEVGHVQRMLKIKPAQLKYLLVGVVNSKSMNSPICVGHGWSSWVPPWGQRGWSIIHGD